MLSSDTLVQEVGALLIERGITIACAESCTGGLFAGALTDVPGISSVFDRGLVTYSNRSKTEELGVLPSTLETYDAVSAETAFEMAEGLFRVCRCELCISVTGLAGPGGGCEERPVGLAFLGIRYQGSTRTVRVFLKDRTRRQYREDLVNVILGIVKELVLSGTVPESVDL